MFPNKSYNRFRGKPLADDFDSFHLNSKGFKDVEFSKEKKIGVFRILGIGDSFVFGVVPHQYNFLTVLENKLNQGNKSFEVINMGIPRLGPDGYFALLINEGLKLNPDQVVCFFFIGNDFTDELQDDEIFYISSFIKYALKIAPQYYKEIINTDFKYIDDNPSFSLDDFMRIEKERSDIFVKNNLWQSMKFKYSLSYLKRMKDACDHRHIKFLVVLIPDELQVNSSLQSEFFRYFKEMRQAALDFSLPNRWLRSRLEQAQIDFLDLLDDFLKHAKDKKLYKPNDTHWNIAGNELAANLILDKLKRLLPDKAE